MKNRVHLKYYPKGKRLLDITLSIFLLLLTFPILVLVAVLLFIELKKSPVFIQERGITLNSFRFKIVKFKTIKHSKNVAINSNNNIFYKPSLETSLTKFSNWLRKTGLDELPQLLNVVAGNMSLIGPRPLMLSDLELMKQKYPEFYAKRDQFFSKPGISGLWQIYGERDKGVENLIKLEAEYEKNSSLILDLRLMLATIPIVLFASHSDAISNSSAFHKDKPIKCFPTNMKKRLTWERDSRFQISDKR